MANWSDEQLYNVGITLVSFTRHTTCLLAVATVKGVGNVLRPRSVDAKVSAWLAIGLVRALQVGAGTAVSSNNSTVTPDVAVYVVAWLPPFCKATTSN